MKKISLILGFYTILLATSLAQYAPAAGQAGSRAVSKNSSDIVAWATACSVQRGLVNNSDSLGAYASVGDSSNALGMVGTGAVVSLGDGGVATLTFASPIRNGQGADFVVFENAFSSTFLELALVEVSSDGVHFVRFAAVSNTDTSQQVGSFGTVDATKLYNLAGKYQANYGTPFDLEELAADSAVLNINAVTHIRIIDAVGSIQNAFATRDSRGVKINDPWPTAFASSGFDLDGVGVIHNQTTIGVNRLIDKSLVSIYPNPMRLGQWLQIETDLEDYQLIIYNWQGQKIIEKKDSPKQINSSDLGAGIYILNILAAGKIYTQKIKID